LGGVATCQEISAQEAPAQEGPAQGEEEKPDAEQEALFAARGVVLASLAAEMEPRLGAGYLAILPPEVVDEEEVAADLVAGWETVLAQELRKVRSDVRLTERGALSAILREQKFGDSAYADPQTAVRVGQIAAARTLLLTRLHQFHSDRPTVRVHLEAKLLDVESGEVVAPGFAMPHSPRIHHGQIWLLDSGRGALVRVDAKISIIGRVKEAVLPVPVCAQPSTSRPIRT
jgi:hypothetical protein